MTEEPKPESPNDDEEFQRVLRNLVNTPHKPHDKKTDDQTPRKTKPVAT